MKDDERLQETLRKVRRLEVLMRGLVRESVAGAYHSCFRGQGIDFEDFREYQAGDEIRAIDWNVTARMGVPYIKKFTEERELAVFLAVDISDSGLFGSQETSKRELAAEIAALLAFSAQHYHDKVGLVLFSGKVDLYLSPLQGYTHCLRLLREIFYCTPSSGGTDFQAPLNLLLRRVPRRSLVFLLSDFIGHGLEDALGAVAIKHDVVAVHLTDPAEVDLPDAGRITMTDPETGEQTIVNTSSSKVREAYRIRRALWQKEFESTLKHFAVDKLELRNGNDYVPALRAFLKRKGRGVK